jgi:integrase
VVGLKVDDVAPGGYADDRASVRQKKTGRPVRFELTESTRQAIDDYLRTTGKKLGDRLFAGRRGSGCAFLFLAAMAAVFGIAKWLGPVLTQRGWS